MKQAKVLKAFRIRNEVLQRCKELAEKENRSLNNVVETAIMKAIKYKP